MVDVTDLRRQTNTIRIEITKIGFKKLDCDIDQLIDNLVKEIKTILEQRELPPNLHIKIKLD